MMGRNLRHKIAVPLAAASALVVVLGADVSVYMASEHDAKLDAPPAGYRIISPGFARPRASGCEPGSTKPYCPPPPDADEDREPCPDPTGQLPGRKVEWCPPDFYNPTGVPAKWW